MFWSGFSLRIAALLLLMLGFGVGAGVTAALHLGPIVLRPAHFEVEGETIRASTASGQTVWTYSLDRVGVRPPNMAHSIAEEGDLDGDGSPEVAVAVSFSPLNNVSNDRSDTVFLFDRRGHLRWRFAPDVTLTQGRDVYTGPWQLFDIAFSSAPPRRLWLTYGHLTWHPSFVIELTADGVQSIRYVQAGRIHSLVHWHPANGADYLAVGGTTGPEVLPAVAVVDLNGPPARFPAADPALTCATCPGAVPPKAVLLLERSEVGRVMARSETFVFRMLTMQNRLRIETDEGPRPALLVWLQPEFTISGAMRPPRYWIAHRSLESEGRLAHTADACPERQNFGAFRIWTPHADWTRHTLPHTGSDGAAPDGTAVSVTSPTR